MITRQLLHSHVLISLAFFIMGEENYWNGLETLLGGTEINEKSV